MSDDMKRALNELRAELRKSMGDLQRDKDDLRSLFRRTMIDVADMAGDIAGIKRCLATQVATKDDISMLNERMDKFAGSQSKVHRA